MTPAPEEDEVYIHERDGRRCVDHPTGDHEWVCLTCLEESWQESMTDALKPIAGEFCIRGIVSGFWFRVFGYGLSVSNMPPLFSERYGYARVLRISGWGVRVLRPDRLSHEALRPSAPTEADQ